MKKSRKTNYAKGRKKGVKNLKKTEQGNFINQYGVEFTPSEKKKLENEVNKNNRKRKKMLEEEGNLPRLVSGRETGEKVKSLQLMGKESDFILSHKSKSLQRFQTRKQFDSYMKNLEKVNSADYVNMRLRLYKRNHMKALENVFGDEAKDVIMKIRMMKPKEYMKLAQSDENLEISYVYSPEARSGKLNRIRAGYGMKLKEEEVDLIPGVYR